MSHVDLKIRVSSVELSYMHKNVLQILLIFAHGRIPCNLVSKYRIHLAVHQRAGGMLVMNQIFPPTHETAPLFLYKNVILATHSLSRFHALSSVWLNFECWCQANFGLNVTCRMKKWANVVCRNKAFMGPISVQTCKLHFYLPMPII